MEKRKFEMTEAQARSIASNDETVRLYLGGPVIALLLRRENAYDSWERVRRELDDTYSSPNTFIALRDRYAFFPACILPFIPFILALRPYVHAYRDVPNM
jgi:hypothetical protein